MKPSPHIAVGPIIAKRQARLSRTLKGFPSSYPSLIALPSTLANFD
jgi:hypothetical protein